LLLLLLLLLCVWVTEYIIGSLRRGLRLRSVSLVLSKLLVI
jgi:hypothetical protein